MSPTGLPHPWDSPGKNTGVGCHFLLQCMKVKSESEVAQSCLTLHSPRDRSLPGSSVHGVFQARVLEWVAIASPSWKLGIYKFRPLPRKWSLKTSKNKMLPQGNFWYFFLCSPFFWPLEKPYGPDTDKKSVRRPFTTHIFIVSSTARHITCPIMYRRIYSEASVKEKMPHRHKSLPFSFCGYGWRLYSPAGRVQRTQKLRIKDQHLLVTFCIDKEFHTNRTTIMPKL